MRIAWLVALLLGCGRHRFDPIADDGRDDSVTGCFAITACVADGCCPPGCAGNDPDCATVCGDSVCVGNAGETCETCPECNTQSVVCGNEQCQLGETDGACVRDCGPSPWPSAWITEASLLATAVNTHRTQGTDCPAMPEPMLPALTMDAAATLVAQWGAWSAANRSTLTMTCNGHTLADLNAVAGINAGGAVYCFGGGGGTAQMAADGYMTTASLCDAVIMRSDAIAIGTGYAETPQSRCWFTAIRI
jgi:hypothetical protein